MQIFLTELRNRWKLVLLIAILAAAALVGEKALTKAPLAKSTSVYIEQQVHIRYEGVQPGTAKYEGLFSSYGNLLAFLRQSEQTFDYTKFQPGWNDMDEETKCKWLKKHLVVYDVTPGIVGAAFYVGQNEWKDAAYARENSERFLETFLRFNEELLQQFDPSVTFELQEPIELSPKEIAVSRSSFLAKYAVIGFVLGALAGIFIVLVFAVRKRHA